MRLYHSTTDDFAQQLINTESICLNKALVVVLSIHISPLAAPIRVIGEFRAGQDPGEEGSVQFNQFGVSTSDFITIVQRLFANHLFPASRLQMSEDIVTNRDGTTPVSSFTQINQSELMGAVSVLSFPMEENQCSSCAPTESSAAASSG